MYNSFIFITGTTLPIGSATRALTIKNTKQDRSYLVLIEGYPNFLTSLQQLLDQHTWDPATRHYKVF